MSKNLQDWFMENKPADDLLWKDGLAKQVMFIRDTIPGILSRSFEEFKEIQLGTEVISTHMSKSVTLPVYRLEWNKYIFIMRYNFYDWKVSVQAPIGKSLVANFMGLFEEDAEIHSVYCEGFSDDKVFVPYSVSKKDFTCSIVDNYKLYTFFWIVKHYTLKEE